MLVDEQTRHTHTRAYAHGGQEDLLLLPARLAQTSHNLPRARASERVAQRDRSTADVHLLGVDLQLVQAVHRHGGERLVELDQVDVVDREVELVQELGDGDGGADSHDPGRETRDGGADEFGENGLTQLLCFRALHE